MLQDRLKQSLRVEAEQNIKRCTDQICYQQEPTPKSSLYQLALEPCLPKLVSVFALRYVCSAIKIHIPSVVAQFHAWSRARVDRLPGRACNVAYVTRGKVERPQAAPLVSLNTTRTFFLQTRCIFVIFSVTRYQLLPSTMAPYRFSLLMVYVHTPFTKQEEEKHRMGIITLMLSYSVFSS